MRLVQGLIDALSLGSLYALLGLGIAVIIGIIGLINFAHSELIMAGSYILFVTDSLAWPASVAIVFLGVVLLALAMERVAFRRIRGADQATGLITSFAVSYLLQNLAILIFSSRPKTVETPALLSETIELGGLRVGVLSVFVVALTSLLITGLVLFFKRTRLGIEMRAAAEDFEMARLLGVKADTVIATAFLISGVLASVAAILLVGQTGTLTPTMGVPAVLTAFAVTILGGMGNLGGAVAAGYLLGALTVGFQSWLPLDVRPYRDAFVFGVVILMISLRPQGLFPTKSAKQQV